MNKIKVIFGRKNSCLEHIFKKTSLICDSDDAFGAQHVLCIKRPTFIGLAPSTLRQKVYVGWTTRQGFFVSTLMVAWTSSAISDMGVLSPDTHQLGSPVQLPGGEERGGMGAKGHRLVDVHVDSASLEKGLCSYPGVPLSSSLPQDKFSIDRVIPHPQWWGIFACCAFCSQGPQRSMWYNFLNKCFEV